MSVIHRLDTEADLLGLAQQNRARYPHLLASASTQGKNSRFDILFAFPEETLSLTTQGLCFDGPFASRSSDFFQALNEWFLKERIDESSKLPFTGGWFIYLAYELAQYIEPSLNLPIADGQIIALVTRFRSALVYDKCTREMYLVLENNLNSEERRARIKTVSADLRKCLSVRIADIPSHRLLPPSGDDYRKQVSRVLDYIREGDIFQANLSRCWQISLSRPVESSGLFAKLRQHNPSPFAALMRSQDMDLISASPERLFSVSKGWIQTRPIAGTRSRLGDDNVVRSELLTHPKERAEHIMLIDLERNDLGRICQPGTVQVDELMGLESYAHVHHIVSNIRGKLRPQILPGDMIKAVFPGGTITGCPKVRCMQILADLERSPRGAYTGSLGYLNRNGDMDLNILIRTVVQTGNQLAIRAGGGIVADSIAELELEETYAKAKGLLALLGQASETCCLG